MEGYGFLTGLMQSTWDASQSYLGKGVHLSNVHSATFDMLRTEVTRFVVASPSSVRKLSNPTA